MSASELPIASLRGALHEALEGGPVVVSSPTGSGKSTEVPRWCADGRVVVIEPRRVACQSLAARVSFLEGTALSASDLIPEDLPSELRAVLDKEFPRTVDVGDARYAAD